MPINRHGVELGVVVGLGNMFIFQHFMPPVADVRAADQFNTDIEKAERTALLFAVGFTTLAAGFVKSWDTFLIAGAVIVGVDFAYKHANAVHPDTGTMKSPADQMGSMDTANMHPLPDYADIGQS